MAKKKIVQFRDFEEEAKLREAEDCGIADLISSASGLSPSGLGIVNFDQAISNIAELTTRAERAFELRCYIEAISLHVQHIELWLRLFWIAKNRGGKLFEPDDKRTFGQIISDCERIGFDAELIQLMRAFNLHRTRAIHKFILGATDYEHLEVICARYVALPARVGLFTRQALGSSATQE